MKRYILTIEYNEDTEEIEYLSEEILDDENSQYIGDLSLKDFWDDDDLEFIYKSYIIGES
tara:strand:- start:1971 stop:2150 length:180 start_codon:yes stop_codon:yes gene_type:complete